jgi:hypothetical protein
MIEIEKKLKDGYPKLTRFKVSVLYFQSDERSGVISEVFPNKKYKLEYNYNYLVESIIIK